MRLSVVLLVLLVAQTALAARITRGPYLQMGSETAVTIVWRTDVPTTGKVTYETAGSAAATVESTKEATQHELRITGLKPATRYTYRVGTASETLAGGDERHFFVTSPPVGSRTRFRAWVVGDSGTGSATQAAVRDAMVRDVGADRPDIYLHLGDMAYQEGTEEQFQMNFFDVYQPVLRNTVVWPTIGNHEAKSSDSPTQSGPYYDAYVLPTKGEAGGLPSGTEAWYSFDYANVHFVVLDSDDSPTELDGPMLTWLAEDLAATHQDWIIAFMHHPPYSKGSHDSDREGKLTVMRERVLPILEGAGVDLVLAGHSHIYERSYLIDGAYETPSLPGLHILDSGDGRPLGDGPYTKRPKTANDGTVYVVAGHGGANISGPGNHPLMFTTEKTHGSSLLDIDGDRLTLTNITHEGKRTDTFTLMKAQSLVIGSPNGGEQLAAGTTHPIRWASKGERPTVNIDYSLDGGATWKAAANAVANTGSWDWTVPEATSTTTLVRVIDAGAPDVSDVSDASFTVYQGATPPQRPNSPPELVDLGTYEGPAGTMLTLQLRGFDPDGDPLTWSVEELPEGASLTGTFFFWIPRLTQAGVWDLTFVADDGRGGVTKTVWTARLADEDGVVPEPEAPAPEAPPEKTSGCGCAGSGAGLLAAVALAGLSGRRRRR